MIIFSKNNYKYFIGFLIAFIFIVLVYGNYNLKINIIETFDKTSNCDQGTFAVTPIVNNVSTIGTKSTIGTTKSNDENMSLAPASMSEAERISKQQYCDLKNSNR